MKREIDPYERYRRDRIWVNKNLYGLAEEHKRYIAVLNEKVVAEGNTFSELVAELDRLNINPTATETCIQELPHTHRHPNKDEPKGRIYYENTDREGHAIRRRKRNAGFGAATAVVGVVVVVLMLCFIVMPICLVPQTEPQPSPTSSVASIEIQARYAYNGSDVGYDDGFTAYLVSQDDWRQMGVVGDGRIVFDLVEATQGESFNLVLASNAFDENGSRHESSWWIKVIQVYDYRSYYPERHLVEPYRIYVEDAVSV